MSFDPSNCFLYADWKHPMQFFTTITFPLATIYLTVWAFYQQQWFYLLFALLSAGFSVLVYQLYYTSEICWNEEQIVYREGEKTVTIYWKDVEFVGGFVSGRHSSRHISRDEMVKASVLSTPILYISTDKNQLPFQKKTNTEGCIAFQHRRGMLKQVERLSGVRYSKPK